MSHEGAPAPHPTEAEQRAGSQTLIGPGTVFLIAGSFSDPQCCELAWSSGRRGSQTRGWNQPPTQPWLEPTAMINHALGSGVSARQREEPAISTGCLKRGGSRAGPALILDKVGWKPQGLCGNSDPFTSPCTVLQMTQGFPLSFVTGHLPSLLYEAELRI